MNYLAHAYLSFNNPYLLIGNMIADMVKGKQIYNYRDEIQQGIRLHREIDNFTDHHPIVLELKKIFTDSVGRYNASFLDISFDHFLALDSSKEPAGGWRCFSARSYRIIEGETEKLPANFYRLFSYMKQEDWLYNYRYEWMIEKSFKRLNQRAKFLENDTNVYMDFIDNYEFLKEGYNNFFPQLEAFSVKYWDENKCL